MNKIILCGGILFMAVTLNVSGAGNLLPNGDFMEGDQMPVGWKCAGGQCAWVRPEGSAEGVLSVTGDGKNSNAWHSEPVQFLPNRVYRMSFRARGEVSSGGTMISGPDFAHMDSGVPKNEWFWYSHVFVTPPREKDFSTAVRLGQWHLNGTAFFGDARLEEVEPVHRRFGALLLGAGERIEDTHYYFKAPLALENHNHSRPLAEFNAGFNTCRWCVSAGTGVTYRHALEGRKLLSGQVEVMCGYYVAGQLLVDVSRDRQEWRTIGTITNKVPQKMELPADMFPAETVYVRLQGEALQGEKPSCQLQVHAYDFEGTVDGVPLQTEGSTQYVIMESRMPRLNVKVLGLGDVIPGGDTFAEMRVKNQTGAEYATEARVVFSQSGMMSRTNQVAVTLPSGTSEVRVPYDVPGTGEWEMALELGSAFTARSSVAVPVFYDDSYGELLVSGNPDIALWRASSGWKIPRSRALPQPTAKSIVIRAARNEWEAVQLVVTPRVALTNVLVKAGELVCGAHRIPAENIRVLRVGYVSVTQPTDSTGTRAEWPDPLLPQAAPVTLEPGLNQPYWIKVKIPKDALEGMYRGTVTVEADGLLITALLNVEVFGFTLPDTMTCETAFGLSANRIWRYHGALDAGQKREVWDKYLLALSESHISPYNPASLDQWTVKWQGLNPWRGGVIDREVKAEGKSSLFIDDASESANVSVVYTHAIALPKKGLRIACKHKTTDSQKFLISISYIDAAGVWLSGRNTDIAVQGADTWQTFERVQKTFPTGAVSCRITVFAAGWQNSGEAMGGLWLDAFSVLDLANDKEMVEGGDFEPPDLESVHPVFDWTAWDAAMERAFTEYHFNSFRMRIDGLGGGTFHERYEPAFLGYQGGTPEYELLIGKYLKGIEDHLREKGWLDKAYVYWFDEPAPQDYEFVKRGFETLKKHAPELRRMLTEQVEPELVGGPNLWCPLTPHLNVPGTAERRAAGDDFWWYVCCSPKAPYVTDFIDHPGTEMRVWLWQTWAERVSGILLWETVYWTSDAAYPDRSRPQNPYLDPMGWVSGYSTEPGTKRPWGNGEGRTLYPPLAGADGRSSTPVLDGPVVSFRLEMLRDGLEDFEYFVILRDLLEQKGGMLETRERTRIEALLTVPAEVSTDLTTFTKNPASLETHREALARAISMLLKR